MNWFDVGTKKMSGPSFGNFIKLMKLQCTGSWVLPRRRGPGVATAPVSTALPVPGRHWPPEHTALQWLPEMAASAATETRSGQFWGGHHDAPVLVSFWLPALLPFVILIRLCFNLGNSLALEVFVYAWHQLPLSVFVVLLRYWHHKALNVVV